MKTIIIAEAGVNHNGDLKIAKKLVDVAKSAKTDYIKFQSFDYKKLVTELAPKAKYQKLNNKIKETQRVMLKRLQISFFEQKKLINYCKKRKIKYLSTAFDISNLKFLLKNKIDYIKIPSGEITNLDLLEFIAKKNKKILLSTGASTLKDVENAIKIISSKKKKNITILQCNSAYPTSIKDMNLNVIKFFSKKYKFAKIGLSDHSIGIESGIAAVAIGAKIIEKHFTENKKLNGPDHKMSLNPDELKNFIKCIKNIPKALGNYNKKITDSEKINIFPARKSIFATKDIKEGEKFSEKNITTKRPEKGIKASEWNRVLNKKSKYNFKKDQKIKL